MRFSTTGSRRWSFTSAFTLIELLVVIAIIGILAALLLPVLSQARLRAQTTACLNNLDQLEQCCHLYSTDFNDYLVPNQVGGFVSAPTTNDTTSSVANANSWCPGLATSDTTPAGIESGLLFPYNKSAAIYHCPSDRSTVEGYPDLLRTRSYCMDIGLGCDDPSVRAYFKYTEILQPPPNQLFVFIDTQENDIFDGTFGIFSPDSYYSDYWLDVPADRHAQGANLSFADGHVEHWKWNAPMETDGPFWPAYSTADLQDLQKLQQHVKPDVDEY
ncbi:MAG TPA: prepilin-type N-terminal cleavage/methylation domain-containing protein [Verrucomicrobiae bacterium]